MVVLSPNFTVLASLSALAVVSMLPAGTEAIALPSTPQRRPASNGGAYAQHEQANAATTRGRDGKDSFSPSVKGPDADASSMSQNAIPTLSLPNLSGRGTLGVEHLPSTGDAVEKRLWDTASPLLRIAELKLGARELHDDMKVTGNNDHVHIHDSDGHNKYIVSGDNEHVHVHGRSPTPEPHHRHHHHHGSHSSVVVSGDDDHVNLHTRRSPRSRHHHHDKVVVSGDHDHVDVHQRRSPHGHHHQDKVVVSGDHDHVNIRHKRAPHRHYRHHRPHFRRSSSDADNEDDSDHLSTRLMVGRGSTLLVSSLSGSTPPSRASVMTRRQMESAFSETSGVPGTIDIMSSVDGSSTGERLASLALSLAPGGLSAFVLDASGTNQTQVYMVAIPDSSSGTGDSPSPSASSSSTGSAYPSSTSSSTASAGSTSLMSSMPPSPTGSSGSANSTSPSTTPYKMVKLKVNMFDAATASMRAYCATFEPCPQTPAPLTAESCSDDPTNDAHKSQVFAYYSETNIITPMWLTGEGNGNTCGEVKDVKNDGEQGSSDDDSGGASTDGSPTAGNITSTADVDATVARLTSLSDKLEDNDSTVPAKPSMVAAEQHPDAQSVTLKFSPMVAEIAPYPAPDERLASSSSSSASETSTSTSSNTDMSSAFVSTTVTFSTPSASPTESQTSTSDSSSAAFSPASAVDSPTTSNLASTTDSSTTTSASSSPTSTMESSTTSASPNLTSTTDSLPTVSASETDSTASQSSSVTDSAVSLASATDDASSAFTTSSTTSSSASTSSISTTSTLTSSEASPTMSVHSLGVEVFDPDATLATSDAASATPTDVSSTLSPTSSGASSSSAPSMTPYSTAPYEWLFKKSS